MYYAIFGLIFVLLIIFCVLASKTWHWINIVFLLLTFLAGLCATMGAAKYIHLHRKAMVEADKQIKRADKAQAEANEAIFGSPDSISYGPESLRGINELLSREMMGRGRVWSKGTVDIDGDFRRFKFSVVRPAESLAINKMDGIVVYAFADGSIGEQAYPVNYIGTFRVVEESPSEVKLATSFVANEAAYAQPAGTWSLFEKMPIDRRDAFKKVENIKDEDFDVGAYRELLTTKYLPADALGIDPASGEYEAIIDGFAFDGMKLGDINQWISSQPNRIATTFEPIGQEVFVEFRFEARTADVFVVDAEGTVENDGAFTQLGHAVDKALHAGRKISFAKGDTILVDQLSADGYQRSDNSPVQGFKTQYPVTEVARYYVRQLKDYPYMLSDLQRQAQRFEIETARVKVNVESTQVALDDALAQETVRQKIIAGLRSDQENLSNDLAVIQELLEQRKKQVDELQSKNRMLEAQIESQQLMLKTSSFRPQTGTDRSIVDAIPSSSR